MPKDDLTFAVIPSLTCETVELGYSLISATIPNLKSFVMSFDTAMMMDVSFKLKPYSQSQSTAGNRSDRIGSSSSKSNRLPALSDNESRVDFIGRLRPDNEGLQYTSHIHHFDDWSLSRDDIPIRRPDRNLQEGLIRRDVHWRVE
jgi:hypothetical protein